MMIFSSQVDISKWQVNIKTTSRHIDDKSNYLTSGDRNMPPHTCTFAEQNKIEKV